MHNGIFMEPTVFFLLKLMQMPYYSALHNFVKIERF